MNNWIQDWEDLNTRLEAEALYDFDPVKAVKKAKYTLAIHEAKLREADEHTKHLECSKEACIL